MNKTYITNFTGYGAALSHHDLVILQSWTLIFVLGSCTTQVMIIFELMWGRYGHFIVVVWGLLVLVLLLLLSSIHHPIWSRMLHILLMIYLRLVAMCSRRWVHWKNRSHFVHCHWLIVIRKSLLQHLSWHNQRTWLIHWSTWLPAHSWHSSTTSHSL